MRPHGTIPLTDLSANRHGLIRTQGSLVHQYESQLLNPQFIAYSPHPSGMPLQGGGSYDAACFVPEGGPSCADWVCALFCPCASGAAASDAAPASLVVLPCSSAAAVASGLASTRKA